MLRKSFMAESTAPRIDASLVRHERAGQATCSIALILSSRSTFSPRYRGNTRGRTGQFGSGTRDAVIAVESTEFSHGARTCSRPWESARVCFTSEFTIFGVNRELKSSNTMECRVRGSYRSSGLSYADLRLCRTRPVAEDRKKRERKRGSSKHTSEEYENRRSNACVSCASNKTRYSHTGPKLGLPFRPPAVGNSYVSDAQASTPRNQS